MSIARLLLTLLSFSFLLVFGGSSQPSPWLHTCQTLAGLLVILMWVPALAMGVYTRRAIFGVCLMLAAFVVVVAQLIPLPPWVWSMMAGREFVVEASTLFGKTEVWLPLSLDVENTKLVFLSMIPCAAFFAVGIKMPYQDRWKFALCIVAFAVLGVFVGLGQRYALPLGGGLPFLPNSRDVIAGTFGNRNFFAASLYLSIPFLAALAISVLARKLSRPIIVCLFAILYLSIILMGLMVTGSRMGLSLTMAAILLSSFLVVGVWSGSSRSAVSKLLAIGVLVGIVITSQLGLVSLLRIAETDPINDQRFVMYRITTQAAKANLPNGTGFGTFVPVYQRFEKPQEMMGSAYVNHAHNDWLELMLEGGWPAIGLLAAFFVWFCMATLAVWSSALSTAFDLTQRAASVSVVLLLGHSLFDFPLRTPALLTVFGLCLGLLAAQGATMQRRVNKTPTDTKVIPAYGQIKVRDSSQPIWPGARKPS